MPKKKRYHNSGGEFSFPSGMNSFANMPQQSFVKTISKPQPMMFREYNDKMSGSDRKIAENIRMAKSQSTDIKY